MKREGPSLFAWLAGRVLYPPGSDPCAVCGKPGAAADVVRRLEREGLARAAHLGALCPDCRRAALERGVRRDS